MPCALCCVNGITLCYHVQLGISRCDDPAVRETSLVLSLLSAPAESGITRNPHQVRV